MGEDDYDIAVIGAGVAGASAAAELSAHASVALLEREDQCGYHATGRSAAILAQNYGAPLVQALTRASEPFFAAHDPGFSDAPLLSPRGLMRIARADQVARLEALYAVMRRVGGLRWIDGEEARRRAPLLRPGRIVAAFVNDSAQDIDVHALHQGYLRALRRNGGVVIAGAEATRLSPAGRRWRIDAAGREIRADIVVNAAGAWADEIAARAGVAPLGLTPMRRTAITFDAPAGAALDGLPMIVDADEAFYLKPEAGRLLASPADETPSPPCDSRPEEIDIAICVDRVTQAFEVDVARISSRWAGLRTFAADRAPVCGFDAAAPGFFWLAGQGGFGVQTAPALARLTAALALGRPIDDALTATGVTPDQIAPGRPRLAA